MCANESKWKELTRQTPSKFVRLLQNETVQNVANRYFICTYILSFSLIDASESKAQNVPKVRQISIIGFSTSSRKSYYWNLLSVYLLSSNTQRRSYWKKGLNQKGRDSDIITECLLLYNTVDYEFMALKNQLAIKAVTPGKKAWFPTKHYLNRLHVEADLKN